MKLAGVLAAFSLTVLLRAVSVTALPLASCGTPGAQPVLNGSASLCTAPLVEQGALLDGAPRVLDARAPRVVDAAAPSAERTKAS